MAYEVVARYNSLRKPGVIHEVKQHDDGVISCSCAGWRFSKAKPKVCRHTQHYQAGGEDDMRAVVSADRAVQFVRLLRDHELISGYHAELAIAQLRATGGLGRRGTTAWNIARMLGALTESGLFAPLPEQAQAPTKGRSVRLITLDD